MKKLLIVVSLLLLVSVVAWGATPQYGGRVVQRALEDPMTLDPFFVGGQIYAWDLSYAINGYLFVIGPDGEFQPDLAESWETPDDQTFIFNIRQGVRFHDGVELTADDIVFTIERNLDPDISTYWYSGIKDYVASVEKIDEFTVQLNLNEAFAPIMYALLFPIAPKHSYLELGEDFAFQPIGAGPFKFKEWVVNQHVILEANDDFYGGRPYLDEIEFRVMDYDIALMAFLNEEIDILAVSSQDREMVAENPNLENIIIPGTSWSYLGINQTEGPLSDVRVRQAVSYAINRVEIIENHFNNTVIYGTGPIVPTSWAYNPNVNSYQYNPGRAIQLLREAGYPDGVSLSLKCSTGVASLYELVQYQLGLVGIDLEIIPMEWGLLTADTDVGNFEMHARTWTRQTDPERGINRQFMTDTNNRILGYSNPQIDELALKAAATLDLESRREMYFEIQEILSEDLPVIFLWYGTHFSSYNKRIQNYQLDPFYCFRTFRHMWVEN